MHPQEQGKSQPTQDDRQWNGNIDPFFYLSSELLCIVRIDGSFERVNPEWEKILGFTKAELLSTPFIELVHPEDREATQRELDKLVQGMEIVSFQNRYRCKDGSYKWLKWRSSYSAGDEWVYGVAQETSEPSGDRDRQQQLIESLQKKLQQFQTIADISPLGIFYTNAEGNCLYVNQKWCELAQLSPQDAMGSGWLKGIHPEDRELVFAEWTKMVEQKQKPSFRVELRMIGQDNSITWILAQAVPERGKGGEIIGYVGAVADISDRVHAEAALRETQERWQLAVRGNNDGIWDWNVKTNEVFYSTRWKQMLGYEDWEIAPKSEEWATRVHPEDLEGAWQAVRDHLEGKTPHYNLEYRMRCKDGSYKWILVRGQAVWDETGQPVRMLGSHTDITKRKQMEAALDRTKQELEMRVEERTAQLTAAIAQLETEIAARQDAEVALQKSQSQLDSILNSLNDVVWSMDPNCFEVLFVNAAVERLYQRPCQDFFDNPNLWLEMIHPLDLERVMEHQQEVMEKGKSEREYRIVLGNGEVRYLLSRSMLIYDESGKAVRMDGVLTDITARKLAEQERERLTRILEATPDFVSISNAKGQILYINKAGREMVGLAEDEEVSQIHVLDLSPESAAKALVNEGLATAARVGVWSGETIFLHRDGREIPTSQAIVSHKGESGEVEFFSTIVRDITQPKAAEEALRRSEQLYRAMARNFPNGAIALFDGDLRYTLADGTELPTLGLSRELMEGRTLWEVWPPELYKITEPMYRAALAGQTTVCEVPYGDRTYQLHILPVTNIKGKIFAGMVVAHNITDRKQAEEALRQQQESLRQILDNMPVMMDALDNDYKIVAWNRECERVTGYSAEEMLGHPNALEVLYPDRVYREAMLAQWAKHGDRYLNWELDITTKDGRIRTISWSNVSSDCPIAGWSSWGIGIDITERKRAEMALRQSTSEIQAIFQAFPDLYFRLDSQGIILDYNAGQGELYVAPEVFLGKPMPEVLPVEVRVQFTGALQQVLETQNLVSFEYSLAVNNKIRNYETRLLPLLETQTIAIVRDITDRKRAEEGLRQSEAQFRQLAEREALLNRLARDIRNSLDVDTILATVVQEIHQLLGIDRCIFVWYRSSSDRPFWDIVQEAKNPDLPSMLGCYPTQSKLVEEKILKLEVIREVDLNHPSHPGMRSLHVHYGYRACVLLPIQIPAGEVGLLISINHQQPRIWSDAEMELLQGVSDQLAIALYQAELYKQARESATEARSQAQRVQQTLQELKQTQAQLIQTEKMSSLGQLVAGVAHEINNPVNFIHGNLDCLNDYTQDLLSIVHLYQQHYPDPNPELEAVLEEMELSYIAEDLPKILSSMRMGTERIRTIVLSLRNFSRLDEADMKEVDLHEGIDNTLLILQNRFKAKSDRPAIHLIQEYGTLPLVECYASQMNQVFMNIINNAIDALESVVPSHSSLVPRSKSPTDKGQMTNDPGQKTIRIRTYTEGAIAIIRVADNGPGMTENVQSRLFDPFFTTKPVGKGTGLGLSISYQIVTDKHHGALRYLSEPGLGTEFIIEIPIRQR